MKRALTLFAVMTVAFSFPAGAKSFKGDEVVKAVTTADLREAVEQAGGTVDEELEAGNVGVKATTADGLLYSLTGAVCDEDGLAGCQGILMQVVYELSDKVTYETVTKANYTYAGVNTTFSPGDEGFIITRFVVVDHGVTRMNIVGNIEILLELAPLASDIALGKGAGED